MQRELPSFSHSRELLGSQLKRSLFLFDADVRAKVEPDGSQSWVHSSIAKKLLFGRGSVEVFKIQSGVKILIRSQDLLVRGSPGIASYTPRGQEKILVTQTVSLVSGECKGSVRTVTLTNRGDSVARARLLTFHDPTSLNYR